MVARASGGQAPSLLLVQE